jgi:ribosomal protein S18 acetylase RimI-like enzyme
VSTAVQILAYNPEHQHWFEKFNRQWIEKYFEMEPLDFQILQNPEKHIIEKGGAIWMASYLGELAGTVALKRVAPALYELTKMAVEEKYQGKKIGQALAETAIVQSKNLGARKIVLYSNTILLPAIALYNKLGFKEIPIDGPYKRTNIKMELILP